MAAAHISGLAALLWGAEPTATVGQIEDAIRLSATLRCSNTEARAGEGLPDAVVALEHLRTMLS
jgi:hypothetical protein